MGTIIIGQLSVNGTHHYWATVTTSCILKIKKTELMVHRYTTVLGSVIMQNKVYGAGDTWMSSETFLPLNPYE